MPIKRIQLRGITRTPSDRQSADGGCAESLNVHIDQYETAPTLPAVDISTDVYPQTFPSGETRYPVVFIHKMNKVTNYIAYDATTRYFRAYGSTLSQTVSGVSEPYGGINYMGGARLSVGESLGYISSVGNTLIVFSNLHPYYFLFRGSGYIFLGTEIPKPIMEIGTLNDSGTYAFSSEIPDGELKESNDRDLWNEAIATDNDNHTELLGAIANMWDEAEIAISQRRHAGLFVAPFFLRYALRLYDGKYIHSSAPIMCGGSKSTNWIRSFVTTSTSGCYMNSTLNDVFRVYLRGSYQTQNWGDIVQSIDIFVSSPVYAPNLQSGFDHMESSHELIFDKMTVSVIDQTIKEEIESKGQFYKVMSMDISDNNAMRLLNNGLMQLLNSDDVSGDGLFNNDDMAGGYRDDIQYIPEAGCSNFNNRLMVVGANELLSRGEMNLNGQAGTYSSDTSSWPSTRPSSDAYIFRYRVVDKATGKESYVMGHNRSNGNPVYPSVFCLDSGDVISLQSSNPLAQKYNICKPYAWLSYPDSRCTQVEVFKNGVSTGKTIPMSEHPMLECSYAFLGFGVTLDDILSSTSYSDTNYTTAENPNINSANKLFLSEFENPFVFPAENIVTFTDNLIGTAVISVPLSQGQFGEHTLYAFTEEGIRVLGVNSAGTFSANTVNPNLSRHVAIPGTIMSLEKSVIFITKKGVMMLVGGSVDEISRSMDGKPYVLDSVMGNSTNGILRGTAWESLIEPASAQETFMEFMNSAKVAYDNNGARLLFFRNDRGYQYEYRLETQTWHKNLSNITGATILNSYPDCLISYIHTDSSTTPATSLPKVMDFSTVLNSYTILNAATSAEYGIPVYGLIVTRSIDLDEPDIRKVIRSIRIRGNYNRGDVKYILLGSFDSINWHLMSSLRGGSYKMFRIALLTKLAPSERITWIDIDYESRFTDKLR